MARDPIIQHFLHDLEGPAWIAKQVEVLPGIVDSEIVYVTPTMDRLYGYVWPDTLVGRHISTIHTFDDAQITRQYAALRQWGFEAPRHYIMHGLHPNGRTVRVVKHVEQHVLDTRTVWVTRHERWHRSAAYPVLQPFRVTALQPEVQRTLLDVISVAHVDHVVPLLRDTHSLESLRARLRAVDVPAPPAPAEREDTARTPLGAYLRQARIACGLSQQALAQRCTQLLGQHVTGKHVSSLEQGHRFPSFPLLQVLTRILDLDPATVLATRRESADAVGHAQPQALQTRGLRDPLLQALLDQVQEATHQLTVVQQAYHEALVTARQGGASWRQLAAATGRSASRIRQLLH